MRVLLLGKNGQVGWELQRSLAPIAEVVALDVDDTAPLCGDLTEVDRIADTVRQVQPIAIINAAAHTAVDKAEAEPARASAINAAGPAALAQAALECDAWLVHYSTDYVFDGSGSTPWTESDVTAPLNVYGRTKLAGEQFIRKSGCRHLILRTSWVYASRGHNFARTMLRLATERDELTVIDDQLGAPTGADLLADVTVHALRSAMLRPAIGGTYHVAASGVTSWFGYARHIIETARSAGQPVRVAPEAIRPASSHTLKTAAARPLNSRLDTTRLRDTFGLVLPHWTTGVDRMLTEVLGL